MGSPYVGEIRMFGGNFAPVGWAFCDGSVVSIAENEVLFNLIGTTYGGDGVQTFALPDLRGRLPLHQGPGYVAGQTGGVENVTLQPTQMPAHVHVLTGTTASGSATNPSGGVWAATAQVPYAPGPTPVVPMSPQAVGFAGGSQPHSNVMPYTCVSFIISLFGIFPSPA